ncbi:MAG: hypothetical protein RL032_2219 [Pseudomonadota bacterium]|jgi:hypothetical protein
MCFSATASFTSAACLASIGGLALAGTKSRLEWPYATIPLLFGVQQLIEGGIWLELLGHSPVASCLSGTVLVNAYSLFSQVVWPLFIPLAVVVMEPVVLRRRAITVAGLSGLMAGMFLLGAMVSNPVTAKITGQHIAYDFSHSHVWAATILYLLGACLSPLLSSFRLVRLFGAVALASAVLTYALFETWFISVWCYFAGWMSSVILLHVYPEVRHHIRRVWASQRV